MNRVTVQVRKNYNFQDNSGQGNVKANIKKVASCREVEYCNLRERKTPINYAEKFSSNEF